MSIYSGPDGSQRLGDLLMDALAGHWTQFRAAVAYAKMSGIDHIHGAVSAFAGATGKSVRLTVGIDQHGTSYEALAALIDLLAPHGHGIYVRYNPRSSAGAPSPTFHPKLWLFSDGHEALLMVGSGNLTAGGLYTNHEVGTAELLRTGDAQEGARIAEAEAFLDRCCDTSKGDVVALDDPMLDRLAAANLVLSEAELRKIARTSARARVLAGGRGAAKSVGDVIFRGESPDPPPDVTIRAPRRSPATGASSSSKSVTAGRTSSGGTAQVLPQHDVLYIHLLTRDKTELYLAKAPTVDDPAFFGLPFTGRTKPRRAGNPSQPQADPWPLVDVDVHTSSGGTKSWTDLRAKVWQYTEGRSANDDVRIFIGARIQNEIDDGSVMVLTRDPGGGLDYKIDTYAPGHPDFPAHDALCTRALPGSTRRYGWG